MMGVSQMVNPIFNFGSERLTELTLLVANVSAKGDRTIGIVLGFPFGIRLGLHVFDDHRLSICFNDVCDAIISQAREHKRVRVLERTLNADEKPRFSEIDWLDWLQ